MRLRLINAGAATSFGLRLAGHPLIVTHVDGRPVERVKVDVLASLWENGTMLNLRPTIPAAGHVCGHSRFAGTG